jgi:hypothetical protein
LLNNSLITHHQLTQLSMNLLLEKFNDTSVHTKKIFYATRIYQKSSMQVTHKNCMDAQLVQIMHNAYTYK